MQRLITLKTLFAIFVLAFISVRPLPAEDGTNELDVSSTEPLFVSLGSVCEPAHMLRFNNLRKLAFPFDWIVSMDMDCMVSILNENFADYLNFDFLECHGGSAGPLFHTKYRLEFLHDGDWNGDGFQKHTPGFLAKYTRRIERFRRLNDYQGHVIFLRSAYPYALTDPHRFYRSVDDIEISEENAHKLYKALKDFFPHLNFTLVVINKHASTTIDLCPLNAEGLVIAWISNTFEQDEKIKVYGELMERLTAGSK